MSTKFKIDEAPISQILINKKLLIPVYQRSYTWKKEHVEALLDDLLARVVDGSSHYFGVVALTSTTTSVNGKDLVISKVIDGQQRLTTSLILLTYLARRCKEVDGMAQDFFVGAPINFSHEMDDSSLKANINSLVNGDYKNLKGLFKSNYDLIASKLNGYSIDFIQKLYDTFKSKFIVATLSYDIDSSEEMLVFENLNSKGSPLKSFDLIRNHIISLTSENSPKTNLNLFNMQIWNLTQTIYKDVASTDDAKEDKLEHFIEVYTIFRKSSKLNPYKNYSVYKNFKELCNGKISAKEFDELLMDIRKYAILYLQMETGKFIGKNIWLKSIGNKENHYPFVFTLFEKYSSFENDQWKMTDEIDKFLKITIFHVIKLMSVMGTGQSLSPMWIDLMDIVKNNHKPEDVKKMLASKKVKGTEQTPSDEEFRQSLLISQKQKWLPYALIDIIEHIAYKKNQSNELVDYVKKTVEHILPQSAKINDWPFIEGKDDEYKQTVNQIGNLVNFNGSANSKLGNKSFAKKLEVYKDSSSPLLKGDILGITPIFKEEKFNFETIKKRTKQLAQIIIDFSNQIN